MGENDVRRFNRWAVDYDQGRLQRIFVGRVQDAVLDIMLSFQSQRLFLLDVGRGTGALLGRAAQRFPEGELHRVDPAPEMVLVAQGSTCANSLISLRPRFRACPSPTPCGEHYAV